VVTLKNKIVTKLKMGKLQDCSNASFC